MAHTQVKNFGSGVDIKSARVNTLLWTICFSLLALIFVLKARLYPDFIDRPVSESVGRLAHFIQRWPVLYRLARGVDGHSLFQGQVLIAIGAAALVKARDPADRAKLFAGGVAAAFAAVLSRLLQMFMPYSPRPLYDAALSWKASMGDAIPPKDWSSFPSDHASLLFGLAFTIWMVNRRLGFLALLVAGGLGLLRIYQGEHYLSDIMAGASLGLFAVATVLYFFPRFERRLTDLAGKHVGLTAAAGFVFFCQASSLFDEVREIFKHML